MESKKSFKWSSFVVSIVGIVFFSILVMTLGFSSSHGAYIKSVSLTTANKNISSGLPIRLTISKIKVDAPVKYVGLTSGGAMDVPSGPYDVAWFNLGSRPGQKGSAVIAGHYGIWKNGAVSVFNKLNTLRKGDIVSIKDDAGANISFIVRESKTFKPNADASSVFGSNDGKSHLNLVTCIFDKVSKKYSGRLVVFTDKVL